MPLPVPAVNPKAAIKRIPRAETHLETWRRFDKGTPVEQIASERNLTVSTIRGHLEKAMDEGKPVDLSRLVDPKMRDEIASLLDRYGEERLKPIVEATQGRATYDDARMVRAWRREARD